MPTRALHVLALICLCLLAPTSLLGAEGDGDSDGDGLWDRFEERWGITDSGKRDSDNDGIQDALEDQDGDRVSNLGEQRYHLDPTDPDSDGDGRGDGVEDYNRDGDSNAADQDARPAPRSLTPDPDVAFWDQPASYDDGCHTAAFSAAVLPCTYGDEKGKVRVALWGDSHALQWLPALDKAGREEGWRVITLTRTACPSVDVAFSGAAYDDDAGSCRRWRAAAGEWLAANRPDVVIISNAGRYPLTDEEGERAYGEAKEPLWQAGLSRALEALAGESLAIVLADTPNLQRNPVSCLAQPGVMLSDCSTRRGQALLPEHDAAERETAEALGAIFASLTDTVCPYDPCPVVSEDTLMWRNESHLTATFAQQLWPALRDIVRDRLAGGRPEAHAASASPAAE